MVGSSGYPLVVLLTDAAPADSCAAGVAHKLETCGGEFVARGVFWDPKGAAHSPISGLPTVTTWVEADRLRGQRGPEGPGAATLFA